MSLVVGTILWVTVVTALVGLVGYVVDRSNAGRARKQ